MKKNIDKIISESIRKTLSEMDWKTTDKALEKTNDYTDRIERVQYAINTIKEFLRPYCDDMSYDVRKYPNSKASKLLAYLDEISMFVSRKEQQRDNMDDLHDYNFRKQHNNVGEREFGNTIPDDENAPLTPSQKEYADWKL